MELQITVVTSVATIPPFATMELAYYHLGQVMAILALALWGFLVRVATALLVVLTRIYVVMELARLLPLLLDLPAIASWDTMLVQIVKDPTTIV